MQKIKNLVSRVIDFILVVMMVSGVFVAAGVVYIFGIVLAFSPVLICLAAIFLLWKIMF
ncbi:hypothetical protein LCGC14_0629960 [marine sediment metagenome]|uniref:Uncharacterized protein n=1 Tax=marine sediment metagenome TaxID=412755 RepID=A0A0F9R7H6_9ZZZZ